MKTAEKALIAIVGLGLAFVAWEIGSSRAARAERARETARLERAAAPTAADDAFADSVLAVVEGIPSMVTITLSDLAAPERDAARISQLLERRTAGTYFGELLATRDSMNFRWPDRSGAPMRVWVQSVTTRGGGANPEFAPLVRDAFSVWSEAGVPIRFTFVLDSARAEIRVTWVDRFDGQMTGRTRWAHDQHRWIVGGSIELALHQPDGTALDRDAVRAIARHEVGHLIGLDHTTDERNIMSARVRVTELSEADRATARLIYQLPPGSLKGAATSTGSASSSPSRAAP